MYPGKGHAPHVHPDEEEVIYVISGEGTQTVGDGTPAFPIKEGDAVYIPAEHPALDLQHDLAAAAARRRLHPGRRRDRPRRSCPTRAILEPGVASGWSQST